MAKYENLCKEVLENIGGAENVTFATHCITRLRFNLADKTKVNQDAVKKISGVLVLGILLKNFFTASSGKKRDRYTGFGVCFAA